jgi:hypothetical protein
MAWKFYDSAGREQASAPVVQINDIGDVVITGPADNEVLAYNNATSQWINQTAAEAGLSDTSHSHTVDGLSDAVITDVADNEVLAYDSGGNWINQTAAEAGIAAADHNHGTNGVKTKVAETDTANPPIISELTTAFGDPATLGDGFIGVLDDGGAGTNVYLVAVANGAFYHLLMTAAAVS